MEVVGNISLAWWLWAMIAAVGILLAICAVLKLHELGICPQREVTKIIRRPWFETLLLLFCVGGLIQYGATKGTTGTGNVNGSLMIQHSGLQSGNLRDLEENLEDTFAITNLCFTGILPLSNAVYLSVAWPTNMFAEGTTLDFFAKISALTNEWTWLDAYPTMPNATNLEVEIAYPVLTSGPIIPSAVFFRVQDRRTCAATMRDTDLDGIPDVYELKNGTNPYVPDASLVHPLTVGKNGTYASVEAALADSTAYSVILLEEETFVQSKSLVLPRHPVLIEGPESGYAVIQSYAEISAIMLTGGQDVQTMFRNLIVDLRAQRNFQAGFWVGGNTPWTGRGAAATFENVRVRANYPGVEHFGWLFYRDDGGPSVLKRCVMNAAGSTWAYGISSYDAASNVVKDCAFLNMPTNAGEVSSIAILMRESTNGVVDVRLPEVSLDLSWAGYPYDGSYSRTADADGDGVSDHDEIFLTNTDPWLADSDGDGIPDGDELGAETDPRNLNSHGYRIDVSVRNADVIPNVTNYVFIGSEDSQWSDMVYSCREGGGTTNFTLKIDDGMLIVSSFRDLNRNGTFDVDYDIALSNRVSGLQAVANIVFPFGDVDGDGVNDLQERLDETDPYSKLSLKISRTVKISNVDHNSAIVDYYTIAQVQDVTDVQWTRMISDQLTIPVSQNTASGCLYALVFRDLNGNGLYEEGVDVLYDKYRFVSGSTEFTVSVGDVDGDTISDSREMQEGTDPMNFKSYCYQVLARISSIFATTNHLTCSALFGPNEILTATIVTNSEFATALGHHSTTNGESVTLWFWDDANSNSVKDVDETCTSISIRPNGHEVMYEGTLSTVAFDRDRNGLLDWWEDQTGLSVLGERHGEMDDNDHDGLINLHEYWAGTDPLTPDGSNTLLSVCTRSIDRRIMDVDPATSVPLFVDYFSNASQERFIRNTNCWARTIDLSCVSAWHDYDEPGSKVATAITRRHVILSKHWWYNGPYTFVTPDGTRTNLSISATYSMPDSDMLIGRLSGDLPESITLPSILPADNDEYLSTGQFLPAVCINKEKAATVLELSDLNTSVLCRGVLYHDYVGVSNTNSVSVQRSLIRSVTSDGNSSTPVFLIADSEPILLFVKHCAVVRGETWWSAWGPSVSVYASEIQSVINRWEKDSSSKYQLKFFPLSNYPALSKKP